MHIRPFDWADEPRVIEIWQRCRLVREDVDPRIDIAQKMTLHPELFLVGEIDEQVVATCMASFTGRRGWINYMAVHPDHQRQGLGRQILAEAERRLAEKGCPKINLRVREGQKALVAFYEKLGYQNEHLVSLAKPLSDGADGG